MCFHIGPRHLQNAQCQKKLNTFFFLISQVVWIEHSLETEKKESLNWKFTFWISSLSSQLTEGEKKQFYQQIQLLKRHLKMSMLWNTSFFILHFGSGEKAFLIILLPLLCTGYYVVLCVAIWFLQLTLSFWGISSAMKHKQFEHWLSHKTPDVA